MTIRRVDGFFYGLFMDVDVLGSYDIVPHKPRRGYVDNVTLHLGQRATLVASAGARAYGMIYSLTHANLHTLYSGAGLSDYQPEAVLANELDGTGSIPCLCFNLLVAPSVDDHNPEYADKLRTALTRLKFPPDYIESIR